VKAWRQFFIDDENRLQWQGDGIVVDRRAVVDTQKTELELRDSVAAPFVTSGQAAVREATGHHARGVMLRRAQQMVAAAGRNGLVVDVGCGFGWHWMDIAVARPDLRFILIDFSAVNLRVCRNLMPFSEHSNVLCVQASAVDLPLRAGVARLAWTVQVLQHLHPEDREKALAEMERILVYGGSFYVAWLRPVPLMKIVYRVAGKKYHVAGDTPSGLYVDRFDAAIETELRRVFPAGRVTLSESIFHPELRIRPRSRWAGALDAAISSMPLGRLAARQAEFSGRK
jgi:SAM-dependent methyltransferase